ncbi:MAG: hypothetical protein ACREQY_10245 [Candidatus Binatia bacterium]
MAALVFVVVSVLAGCVGSWRDEPPRPEDQQAAVVQSPFPGQQIVGDEEVLYEEEDEFGRPITPTGKAGEFLVAATYIGTILAAIILPLLAL